MKVKIGFDTVVLGTEVCIEFTRVTEGHRENYGADADGNRGMMVGMIDSDDAEDIVVTMPSGTERPFETLPDAAQRAVRREVDRYLEENEPEAEDEPERDWDEETS